jgi:PAS domain S-box-containing protein
MRQHACNAGPSCLVRFDTDRGIVGDVSDAAANARSLGGTRATAAFAALGGEIDAALERIGVPAGVLDRRGRIRYLNEAARRWFGDAHGRLFTDLVSPQSQLSVRLALTRQLLGTALVSDSEVVLRTRDGDMPAEMHSVAIEAGKRVVGVFGIADPRSDAPVSPDPRVPTALTPRQREVLGLLAAGRSTAQIADQLKIARETVRNHVRGILRALGVHSRLEAVVEAHRLGLVAD